MLGGRWGAQTALGEENPIPPPLVLWIAAVVPLAAGLIILGRMGAWGGALSWGIFKWETWSPYYYCWSRGRGALRFDRCVFAALCAIIGISAPRTRVKLGA